MLNIIVGFASGIISGLGIGGGAILIPALIMLSGIEQKLAQGINLVYFLPTAVFALIVHIKKGSTDVRNAVVIGLFGIVGAVIGAYIAMGTDNEVLRRMFGIFLGLIGIREIVKGIKS